ncbi:MAG: ribosomal-processing cysteine protease Prp [Lachnospiraceae bacterium]|nr:ribosomal-processing cysteine protease Prp [Lachnospiraceae bacterium]
MTTITVYKSDNESYKGFTCKGHAGFGVSGKDIVCAATSILVINTLNSLDDLVHEEMDVKTDESTGYIDCRFPNEISEQSKLLMDSMVMGLKDIVNLYGKKYLKLRFEEV